MDSSHPGFKAVASKIANREGVSKQSADAILASASRKASPEAKSNNPRLKRVDNKGLQNAIKNRMKGNNK